MINLSHALKRENNNYDLIRLLASLAVIIYHSLVLFIPPDTRIHIPELLMHAWRSLGSLAVFIFFFLSGMFITASFVKSNNALSFIISRFFRIWPGLIVCVILSVFVVGALATSSPIKSYFGNRGTWDYLIHGILLYHVRFELPGVFGHNHFPSAVNGSLWTLPIEVMCYLMVLVFGITGVMKRVIWVILAYAAILVIYYLNVLHLKDFLNTPFPFFIAGSLCYVFRKYIILDYRILIALILGCCFFYTPILLFVSVLYGAAVTGASTFVKRIRLPGDYSYGLYIYGFIIQQLIANYYPNINSLQSLLITIPIVLLISVLSWHFVELPAIKKGKKLAKSAQKIILVDRIIKLPLL